MNLSNKEVLELGIKLKNCFGDEVARTYYFKYVKKYNEEKNNLLKKYLSFNLKSSNIYSYTDVILYIRLIDVLVKLDNVIAAKSMAGYNWCIITPTKADTTSSELVSAFFEMITNKPFNYSNPTNATITTLEKVTAAFNDKNLKYCLVGSAQYNTLSVIITELIKGNYIYSEGCVSSYGN